MNQRVSQEARGGLGGKDKSFLPGETTGDVDEAQ